MKLKFWEKEKEEQPEEPKYVDVEFVFSVLIGKLYQFTAEEMTAEIIKLKNKLNLVLEDATTDEDIRESVEELIQSYISNESLEPVVVRDAKDKEGRYKSIQSFVRDYLHVYPELKPTIDAVIAEAGLPVRTDDILIEEMQRLLYKLKHRG